MAAENNTYTETYNLKTAGSVYGNYTTDLSTIDQISVGFRMVWMAWGLTWTMLFGIFQIYPNMVTIFHMNEMVAWVISAGFYVMIGLEVFVLFMFRVRPPEI